MQAYVYQPDFSSHVPILTQSALISGIVALQQCQAACTQAGMDTVGSYGLMECVDLLQDCSARCEATEKMLLQFAEVDLTLLRCQLSECAEICDRCARACAAHHDFDEWEECASTGRDCADVCRYLLFRLPTSCAVPA